MPAAGVAIQVEIVYAGQTCSGVLIETGAVDIAGDAVAVDAFVLGGIADFFELAGESLGIDEGVVEAGVAVSGDGVVLIAVFADGNAAALTEVGAGLVGAESLYLLANSCH